MNRLARRLVGCLATTALIVGPAGVAGGDSVDVTTSAITIAPGESGSFSVYLVVDDNSTDTVNGCNATADAPVTISFSSSNSAVAGDPSAVTVSDCGLAGAKVVAVAVKSAAVRGATTTITPAASGGRVVEVPGSKPKTSVSGTFSSDTVTVTVEEDPCASAANPAAPVISSAPVAADGSAGWFKTVPTVSAASSTSGATIEYSTDGTTFSAAAPTLGQGTTTVTAKATTSCNKTSSSSQQFKIDSIAPSASPANVVNPTWRNGDLSETFTFADGGSGVAASQGLDVDGKITLTASAESPHTAHPMVVSKEVFDVAGNTVTRSVSALIDKTGPTVTPGNVRPGAWTRSAVSEDFTSSDTQSGLANAADVNFTLTARSESASSAAPTMAQRTVIDLAGNSTTRTVSALIDLTGPTVTGGDVVNTSWRNTDLAQTFTASDALSGLAISTDVNFTLTASAESSRDSAGAVVATLVSKTVADNVGNTTARSVSAMIDKTKPSVALVGAPSGSYYFGSVAAAPTCTASDLLSGVEGACSVSGYSTAVGTHTVTASAIDAAGNSNEATSTYTVLPWTLGGFYQPVDMNGVLNVVKGGSTVPLKFEVFTGATEITSVAAVQTFKVGTINCTATAGSADEIEMYSSGSTVLRYDSTGGQFVQNWQTPKTVGTCYKVVLTTLDGSTSSALFKTK